MQYYIIVVDDARSTRKRSGVQIRFQNGNLVAALFACTCPLQRKERGTDSIGHLLRSVASGISPSDAHMRPCHSR